MKIYNTRLGELVTELKSRRDYLEFCLEYGTNNSPSCNFLKEELRGLSKAELIKESKWLCDNYEKDLQY